jgi:alkaline phosphatase D
MRLSLVRATEAEQTGRSTMAAQRDERLSYTRRRLINTFGAAAGVMISAPLISSRAFAQVAFSENPFRLGVASGDPAPDGFVIWTRLAPKPFEIGFGMPSSRVEVDWEISSDEAFGAIVQSGKAAASPHLAHAVHVEVAGLNPGRHYWYRFRAGGVQSPAGRARTAPAAGAPLARATFGVAGCQNYEAGLFTAHKHLAAENLDFVFCYGDYIYENAGRPTPAGARPGIQSTHFGGEIYSVDDYRRRYAQYKMDPDLQAAHAAHPWFAVWDDHEIDNNWASIFDEGNSPVELFAMRRQAAAQAYYENMPLRMSSFPSGAAIQIYRRARYGDLIDLNLLDTRQYRTNQPCNDRAEGCSVEAVSDPKAEFMGRSQEDWLFKGFAASRAKWNVLAQQMMMMDLDRDPGPNLRYNIDSWAGYRTPRNRILKQIRDRKVPNVIVLTGDEHVNYAGELHLDGLKPEKTPIAVEFVSTSITSGGDGQDQSDGAKALVANNPQLKFINQQRGYVVCDVTPERWQTEFKVLDRISTPGGTLSTRTKLAVAAQSNTLVTA